LNQPQASVVELNKKRKIEWHASVPRLGPVGRYILTLVDHIEPRSSGAGEWRPTLTILRWSTRGCTNALTKSAGSSATGQGTGTSFDTVKPLTLIQ